MPSFLLLEVGLLVAAIRTDDMCHGQGMDLLACGANTTGALGKGGSAPGPTGSTVEPTPTTAADVVTVATLRRRPREGGVDFP